MPLTNAEKQAAFRGRAASAGRSEVRGIYATPEHTVLIKRYAKRLENKLKKDQGKG